MKRAKRGVKYGTRKCAGEFILFTKNRSFKIWKWICLGCGSMVTKDAGEENIPKECNKKKTSSIKHSELC